MFHTPLDSKQVWNDLSAHAQASIESLRKVDKNDLDSDTPEAERSTLSCKLFRQKQKGQQSRSIQFRLICSLETFGMHFHKHNLYGIIANS
jgi:hypothetical protein